MDKDPTRANSLGALARDLYEKRRKRDEHFDPSLFGEPGWDILLDLFALEAEGRTATIAMVAAGMSVPMETAQRHIEQLVAGGFVSREPPGDTRWAFLQLTDEGRERMRAVLSDILKRRGN